MEFEILFENEKLRVSRFKLEAGEEVGLHYDENPATVTAYQGGIITRLENDGTEREVHFPTAVATFRPAEPKEMTHRSINRGSAPVAAIIVEVKKT